METLKVTVHFKDGTSFEYPKATKYSWMTEPGVVIIKFLSNGNPKQHIYNASEVFSVKGDDNP